MRSGEVPSQEGITDKILEAADSSEAAAKARSGPRFSPLKTSTPLNVSAESSLPSAVPHDESILSTRTLPPAESMPPPPVPPARFQSAPPDGENKAGKRSTRQTMAQKLKMSSLKSDLEGVKEDLRSSHKMMALLGK